MSKLTPSTALTRVPRRAGKCLTRFSTRTRGSAETAAGASRSAVSVDTDHLALVEYLGLLAAGRVDPRSSPGADVDDVLGAHLPVGALHRDPAGGVLRRPHLLQLGVVGEALLNPE